MKNIFAKSMLRQPLQTCLFMLLIALASGVFVMRAAEFAIIRTTLHELGNRYRAVGFVRTTHRESLFDDVLAAADVIAASPLIEMEDRRRTVGAVMHGGLINTDISGRTMTGGSRAPYAFFYGTVTEVIVSEEQNARFDVLVEEVIVGYPEHIVAGQTAHIRHHGSPTPKLQEGQRYFLRVRYHYDGSIPIMGNESNFLNWVALNSAPDEPIWYAYTQPNTNWFYEELEWLRHAHAGLNLRTTYEMQYMPAMWQSINAIHLTQGRLITREDYHAKNHVIVIHEHLANFRGLELGDFIEFSIPSEHFITVGDFYFGSNQQMINQLAFRTFPSSEISQTLRLEIVGMYVATYGSRHNQLREAMTAYIPDSILTHDYVLDALWLDFTLPDIWYSFVLYDALDRTAFLEQFGLILAEMGFVLTVPETGAENFWETAHPILQTITFNIVIFTIAAVLVLALAAWIFTRLRRKEFAIRRAMGKPAKSTFLQLTSTLFIFGLPSATLGGVIAWFFATAQAANTLNRFEEVEYIRTIPLPWLVVFITLILAGLLLIFGFLAAKIIRRPILELLR